MLLEEAQWLGKQQRALNSDAIFPMCNLGSATEEFRRVGQPYIDQYLFRSARENGLKVVHVDMKMAPGVDLVGDLTNPAFFRELGHELRDFNVRSVMCCNLLEHVTDRQAVCYGILALLRVGGYVFVSVPRKFPYHEDPIDTMFRPNVTDVVSLFPGTSVHSAAVIRASRFRYEMRGDFNALFWLVVRLVAPFYRTRNWWKAMRKLGRIVVGYRVTCVILRKVAEHPNSVNCGSSRGWPELHEA